MSGRWKGDEIRAVGCVVCMLVGEGSLSSGEDE